MASQYKKKWKYGMSFGFEYLWLGAYNFRISAVSKSVLAY